MSDETRILIFKLTRQVSYLTDLVYTAIAFNVGSGDCPCVSLKQIWKNSMLIGIVRRSQFLLTLESNPKRSLSRGWQR